MPDKVQYKEGSNVEFIIKNQINLADNETYFVLEDKNGRKQLLKADYYKKYNLKIGSKVNCKIDHINCAGKIFIEPKHPYYEEGKIYNFTINELKIIKNRLGKDALLIRTLDKLNNIAFCKIEYEDFSKFELHQQINCKVELIKKSKLYLTFINSKNKSKEIGKFYDFIIKNIKTLTDNFMYYILEDNEKKEYILRFEYYTHHNLQIEQKIKCRLVKFSSEGYYIIEPKHPFYKINKIYDFKILTQKKDNITGNYNITVEDVYKQEVKFVASKHFTDKKISCKTIGLKKGKPLLSI